LPSTGTSAASASANALIAVSRASPAPIVASGADMCFSSRHAPLSAPACAIVPIARIRMHKSSNPDVTTAQVRSMDTLGTFFGEVALADNGTGP
jgi:hypothetical protein